MSSKLSLLVPFRDDGSRARLASWVLARWKFYFPEAEIIVASDDGKDPFCKTMAVNNAAAKASGDILGILDADVWIHARAVREAVEMVASGKAPWVVPSNKVYRLSEGFTDQLLSLDPSIRFPGVGPADVTRVTGVVGFLHLFPREAYDRVGGMDERFRGWGGEDNAWMWALDCLWGKHVTLENTVFHLWHPLPKSPQGKRVWPGQDRRNSPITRAYLAVRRNPSAMSALCEQAKDYRLGRAKDPS